MMSTDTAIIACAGRGTRLGYSIPKSCVEVGGETLLQWQLDALADIRNVVVVVGYRWRYVIEELLTHRKRATVVINEDWDKTNTAYSISLACELYNAHKNVLTIDGDTLFCKKDVQKMLQHDTAIGITTPMSDHGVFVNIDLRNRVIGFTRENNTGHEWTGMSVIPAGFFHSRPNCFVYEVIQKHLPITAQYIKLIEIDTPEDLERARERVKNHKNQGQKD